MLKLSKQKYVKTLVFFFSITDCFAEDIDFLQLHSLNNTNRLYSYPMNVSAGFLINDLPIFNGNLKENNDISKTTLIHVFGIGIDLKISQVITNMFCAKTFGFFPKTGLLVQGFSMNYGRVLLKSLATLFVTLCKLKPKWSFTPPNENGSNFNINILWVNEPETNIFKKYRFIPRIGIGASIINLYHDYDNTTCEHKVNPYLIDLCLLNGIFFVIKKKYCDIEFNVGYTYNPLFHIETNKRNVTGGIINFYTGVSFSFYNNLGLESLEWFDEDFVKNRCHNNNKLFIDILPGLGNLYSHTSGKVTSSKYCQVLASFSWPYLSKVTDDFFYGLSIDISEDIGKTSENLNIDTINNFNLVFNFAQFTFDYKSVRFSHNFGVYVITNLYNTLDTENIKHFGQREISINQNAVDGESTTWIDYMTRRFTYRPRVYISVFKMIRKKEKFNFLDKLAVVIGINSIILNHRNDFALIENRKQKSTNIEFLKIEGFFVGISLNR